MQAADTAKDYYLGLKGIYFNTILNTIIAMGNLSSRNVQILDFGCGRGYLKKKLPGKVIGYDIIPAYSDISDWKTVACDVVVVNEVFYLFSEPELKAFLAALRQKNPDVELIVGMSRQGVINKILATITRVPHDAGTKLKPKDERRILLENMRVLSKRTVFFLCDIYHLKFK